MSGYLNLFRSLDIVSVTLPNRILMNSMHTGLEELGDFNRVAAYYANSPEVAEAILAEGAADLVSMARPFLADPGFVKEARDGRSAEITPCIACDQACLDFIFELKIATCIVNPQAARETELAHCPASRPKSIVVVGAGTAGLSAALVAAERGHAVTLFERAGQFGGQRGMASRVPGKGEFPGLVRWYRDMLEQRGAEVQLDSEHTVAKLTRFEDAVAATGVVPRDPDIPDEGGCAVTYADIPTGNEVAGERVAIVGAGGIGFDVAEFLTSERSATADLDAWLDEWGVTDPDVHWAGLAYSATIWMAACVRVAACGRERLDDGPADGPVDRGQPGALDGIRAELQEEQDGSEIVALRGKVERGELVHPQAWRIRRG